MVSLVTLKYFFFFNDTATTEIYTLSLHDALPISKPNTSGTIKVPASLRSERCSPSARNAVRVPVGISVRLRRNPHRVGTRRREVEILDVDPWADASRELQASQARAPARTFYDNLT